MKIGILKSSSSIISSQILTQSKFDNFTYELQPYNLYDEMVKDLSENNIDSFIVTLHDFIKADNKSLVPAALIGKLPFQFNVLANPSAYDPGEDLKMKKNTTLGCLSAYQALLITNLNQDIKTKVIQPINNVNTETLKIEEIDAILIEINDYVEISDNLKITPLNQREFPQPIGIDTWCMITSKDNIDIRKALKPLHDTSIAEISNYERKIQIHFSDNPNITTCGYTFKDNKQYFHSFIAVVDIQNKSVIRSNISQSTISNMEKAIIDSITNKI